MNIWWLRRMLTRLLAALSAAVRGRLRRLPFICLPAAGESFPSWMDRTAAALSAPAGLLADAVRLPVRAHHSDTVPRMYGVALAPTVAADVEHATGVPVAALHDLHLSRYSPGVLDLTGLDVEDERSLRAVGLREWVSVHGSRACPLCLADSEGVWSLSWKLALVAVCVTHRLLLIEKCPDCGTPLRRSARGGPSVLSRALVPRPTGCDVGRGRRCAGDLTSATTLTMPAPTVDAQHRLLSVVQAGRGSLAGELLDASMYFARIRALVGAVRFAAEEELLPTSTPFVVRDAYLDIVHRSGGRNSVTHGYRAAPGSAAAAAAVLAVLAPALAAATAGEFETAVAPLTDAFMRKRRRRRYNPLRGLPLPAPFEVLPSRFTGPIASAAPIWRAPVIRRSLPQAVDATAYLSIAPWLPATSERTGRRFAALAVARALGASSWPEAGMWCGWSPAQARRYADHAARRVRDPDGLWRAIAIVAQKVSDDDVDWHARRQSHANLVQIDPSDLGPEAVSGRPWTVARRRCAAAWLWASCTDGDWRDSPAMQAPGWAAAPESRRELYRRFIRRCTPELLAALSRSCGCRGGNQ